MHSSSASDDILQAAIALELFDGFLKHAPGKRRIRYVWRIVAKHSRHLFVDRSTLDLLQPKEILFGKLRAMPLVERLYDLG